MFVHCSQEIKGADRRLGDDLCINLLKAIGGAERFLASSSAKLAITDTVWFGCRSRCDRGVRPAGSRSSARPAPIQGIAGAGRRHRFVQCVTRTCGCRTCNVTRQTRKLIFLFPVPAPLEVYLGLVWIVSCKL